VTSFTTHCIISRFDYSEERLEQRRGHIVMIDANIEEFRLGLVSKQ
jgi:hypothetical protein